MTTTRTTTTTTLLIMMHAANQFCCIMPKVCTSTVAGGLGWRKKHLGWQNAVGGATLALRFHPDAQLLCCALCSLNDFQLFFVYFVWFASGFSSLFMCHTPAAMPFLCRNTFGACGMLQHPSVLHFFFARKSLSDALFKELLYWMCNKCCTFYTAAVFLCCRISYFG